MNEKQKQALVAKLCNIGLDKSKLLNKLKPSSKNIAQAAQYNGFLEAIVYVVQEIEKIK